MVPFERICPLLWNESVYQRHICLLLQLCYPNIYRFISIYHGKIHITSFLKAGIACGTWSGRLMSHDWMSNICVFLFGKCNIQLLNSILEICYFHECSSGRGCFQVSITMATLKLLRNKCIICMSNISVHII